MNFLARWTGSSDTTLKRAAAASVPATNASVHSKTWTFFDGDWHEGNVPIMGPRTHAAWLGSMVFDGARAFEGVTPDLDRHCARVNRVGGELSPEAVRLARHLARPRRTRACKRFDANAELYIRPMYWAETGARRRHPPRSRHRPRWCLCIYEAPMPKPTGISITLSPLPPADRGMRPGRRQGRLPLSQQFARA